MSKTKILTDKQFHPICLANRETIVLLVMITIALIAGCQPFDTRSSAASLEMTSTPAPSPIPASIEENPAGAVYWPWPATPEPARLPTGQLCATVTAIKAVHLRTGPSEKAEHIQYLTNGEEVRVLDPAGRWWKIQTSAGTTGYANSRYLQETKCTSKK